jgi:hypothetical protein
VVDSTGMAPVLLLSGFGYPRYTRQQFLMILRLFSMHAKSPMAPMSQSRL